MNHLDKVKKYYEECWNPRLSSGHNTQSNAIHYGYYNKEDIVNLDSEAAKSALNNYVFKKLKLNYFSRTKLLDAGCGIGGTAISLVKKYPFINIFGVNISDTQISIGKERLAKVFEYDMKQGKKVELLNADYHALPFLDNFFDKGYAIESVCHSNDKHKFFEEIHRVLKPKGEFIITDYFLSKPLNDISEKWRKKLEILRKGWALPNFLYDIPNDLFTIANEDNLTVNVLPGMQRSAHKAQELIKNDALSLSKDYINHLKGCIEIYELHKAGVLVYKCVKLIKK